MKWALLLALVTACGDPSLEIRIHVPEIYQAGEGVDADEVARSVLVRVLGASEEVDCEKVAFGELSEQSLAAVELAVSSKSVEEALVFDNEVPREDPKLVYVIASNDVGEPMAAGCSPFGEVEEGSLVDIHLQPMVSVDVRVIQSDATVDVRLFDFRGAVLRWPDGVSVRVEPDSADTTLEPVDVLYTDSRLELPLPEPAVPGPYSLTVRAHYSLDPAEPQALIKQPARIDCECSTCNVGVRDNVLSPLNLPTESRYQIGPFGPGGETAVAASYFRDDQVVLRVVYLDDGGVLRVAERPLPVQAGLGQVANAQGDRSVVFAAGSRWYRFAGLPGLVQEVEGVTPPSDFSLGARPIGGCGAAGDVYRRSAFQFLGDGARWAAVDASLGVVGEQLLEVEDGQAKVLVATGCVQDGQGDLHNTAVFFDPLARQDDPRAEFLEIRSESGPSVLSAGEGQFIPNSVGVAGPYVVGSEIALDGPQIVRREHRVVAGELRLDLHDSLPTPAFASVIASGDFDGDDSEDLAAIIELGNDGDERRALIFLAFKIESASPLVGVDEYRGIDPTLLVADFDEDGKDDLVIADKLGFRVLLMGQADESAGQSCE